MTTAKIPPTAETRLFVPELRPEVVPRARLMWALQAATRCPLTVVCAPAGYGKTTALVQWLEHSGLEHAWLSLGVPDNDPRWFAARLLAALDRALPGCFEQAERALTGGSDVRATVVPLVVNGLIERGGERFAIVLDDYHLVSEDACHAVACDLISALPSGIAILVASRTPPPLRLARRRAAGTLAEVGPEQLRLTLEETRQLLTESLELALEPGQVEQIDGRVHGWAAGLALIATALPAGRNRAGFLDAVAASGGSLHAYLIEEVLDNLRPELRDFLCRTAILDRLSPALCEALLDDSHAGELLEEVRRENLFVTVLDHHAGWVRYHDVFADTLRAELKRREPKLVANLHRRASEWFEEAEMPVEAIDHAIAADDGPRAASLLASAWQGLIYERRHVTLRRILDRLPDDRGELGPLCEALDLECMQYEGVDQRVTQQRAERLAARAGDDPRVRVLLDRLLMTAFAGDIGRSLQHGRALWERCANDPDAQRGVVAGLGMLLWLAGEHEEARRLLEPRLRLEQPTMLKVWMLGTLAITAAEEGDAALAEQHAREAAAEVEAIGGQTAPEFAAVPWILAEALRLGGKLDEARHHLDRGLEAEAHRPGSFGHALVLVIDAQLALDEGDRERARTSARRARQIVDRYPDVGTLETRLAGVEAALDRSSQALRGTQPTPAELRVLQLLDSDRSLADIADELYVSRETVKSHTKRLYRRLGARTREGVVAAARERGLLEHR